MVSEIQKMQNCAPAGEGHNIGWTCLTFFAA